MRWSFQLSRASHGACYRPSSTLRRRLGNLSCRWRGQGRRLTDIVDTSTRSRMMAGIRGRNTKPELLVRSWIHRQGLRFRLHRRDLPGKPDLVFPRYNTVVFVHGCFWHRHANCRYATTPATNRSFWRKKFKDNVARDHSNVQGLRRIGWRVLTIWECELNDRRLVHLARDIRKPSRT